MAGSETVPTRALVTILVAIVLLVTLGALASEGPAPLSERAVTSTPQPDRGNVAPDPTPRPASGTTTAPPQTSRERGAVATTRHPDDSSDLAFTSPGGTASVAGTETVVAGTAPARVGSVALYVRNGGVWEHLDVTPTGETNGTAAVTVAADGTWRGTVDLSGDRSGTRSPDRYALAVVPVSEVRTADGVRRELSDETLSTLASAGTTVDVGPPAPLAQSRPPSGGSAILTIDRQVATEDDRVAVRGTARGQNEVYVFFVGPNGGFSSTTLPVGRDGVFESDDVSLVTFRGRRLQTGFVVAGVYSVGRDGMVGDGEFRGLSRSDLATLNRSEITSIDTLDAFLRLTISNRAQGLRGPGLTQLQILEFLSYETVGAPGSDDLLLEDTFLFTSGRTTIERVGPAAGANATAPPRFAPGETMVVRGVTNRKPDNTIYVEVVDGPSAPLFGVATTSGWGSDGLWSVTLPIPSDAEPGTYTLQSDDGDDLDTVEVEIRPGRENATAGGGTTVPDAGARTGPDDLSSRGDVAERALAGRMRVVRARR